MRLFNLCLLVCLVSCSGGSGDSSSSSEASLVIKESIISSEAQSFKSQLNQSVDDESLYMASDEELNDLVNENLASSEEVAKLSELIK